MFAVFEKVREQKQDIERLMLNNEMYGKEIDLLRLNNKTYREEIERLRKELEQQKGIARAHIKAYLNLKDKMDKIKDLAE